MKTYSDRGKISDLSNRHETTDIPISDAELRVKELYEYAEDNHDEELKKSLGFIVNEYPQSKNYPLIILNLRRVVGDILSSEAAENINKMKLEILDVCFPDDKSMVKNASVKMCGCFRKAQE